MEKNLQEELIRIGKAIEDNISIQNLGDYSTYSDVEAEVMYDCSLAELNK